MSDEDERTETETVPPAPTEPEPIPDVMDSTDGTDAEDPTDATDATGEPEPAEPEKATRPKVMLIGSGELGRELVITFQRLGVDVVAVDSHADAPAHGIADQTWVVQLTDPDALDAVVELVKPDYVVTATDAVAADALAAAETRGIDVVPSARTVRMTLDREGMRRLAADELGLPTAPFWFAGSVDELTAIAEHAGFPLVVKPLVAVPGEGQSVLLRPDDIGPAWQRAIAGPMAGGRFAQQRVLAETVVEIDHEVTLLTVRTAGNAVHFCEPIGHRQVAGALEAWQPQQMSDAALGAAKSIAARIVGALGGRGVFGVELLVRGDEVYFSDVTAVPYDSALVTLRTQRLSEFELRARATLGLPVDTIMISPGAAEVAYGEPGDFTHVAAALSKALEVAETDARIFARQAGSAGSVNGRLALALSTAPDIVRARDRVRQAGIAMRELRQP